MLRSGIEGKVAIVTGANNPHGIGAAIAEALARQGARVLLHYYRSLEKLTGKTPTEPGEAFYRLQQTKSAEEVVRTIQA